jgi:hypothetical protein
VLLLLLPVVLVLLLLPPTFESPLPLPLPEPPVLPSPALLLLLLLLLLPVQSSWPTGGPTRAFCTLLRRSGTPLAPFVARDSAPADGYQSWSSSPSLSSATTQGSSDREDDPSPVTDDPSSLLVSDDRQVVPTDQSESWSCAEADDTYSSSPCIKASLSCRSRLAMCALYPCSLLPLTGSGKNGIVNTLLSSRS